ncbi:ParB N-terminal domain-containing protein [Mycobacterium sp. DBP42]|uniref:ParB/RepB/Spo0J family partition protein n=1 Tax=Mycobacterium sp. DBP42 TaxID=2545267 RepID=UPI002016F021|nr:ParB N-terminal domain-containing protein [Mycobacterium sp. DBP42]
MPKAVPTKTARRPSLGKPGGSRKIPNRYMNLAGGDDVQPPAVIGGSAAAEESDSAGFVGAIAAGVEDATRVVRLAVGEIAPHPFNDPERSAPQPGNEKWEELVNGVRKNGVLLPTLVVPRSEFLAARPAMVNQIPADASYVLIYGHRRRAAALEAGRETIPAVVDASIMVDDGDLDAMAAENLGREDLSSSAKAALFARYADMGLRQEQISERLGVHQSTVSRYLARYLMVSELLATLDNRDPNSPRLKQTEASTIVGALPYGPIRSWQTNPEPDDVQNSETRRQEQLAALELVQKRGMTGSAAAKWVVTARTARAQAAEWGVPIVDDPREELGERFYEYRVPSFDEQPGLIAALDPALATLVLYRRPDSEVAPDASVGTHVDPADPAGDLDGEPEPGADPSQSTDGGNSVPGESASVAPGQGSDEEDEEAAVAAAQRRSEIAAAAAAQAHRRRSCAALINVNMTNTDLTRILVGQYLSGVAARAGTSAVAALLDDWDSSVDGNSDKARATKAWHIAVAAAELHTTELKDKAWDAAAVAHVRLLVDRVGYQPTSWEQTQLDLVP